MVRICAVIGCSNSTEKLDKWHENLCDKHGLFFGSCICTPPFTLFPFPTVARDPDARKRWTKLINRKSKGGRNWEPSYHHRVCSVHFVSGEPTAASPDPTEHLGYDTSKPSFSAKGKQPRKPPRIRETPAPRPTAQRKEALAAKPPVKRKLLEDVLEGDTTEDPDYPTVPPLKRHRPEEHDYATTHVPDCQECSVKAKKVRTLQQKLKRMQRRLKASSRTSGVTNSVLKSDKSVRLFTGIQTRRKFESLFSFLSPKVEKMRYWSGTKKVSSLQGRVEGKSTPQKPGPVRSMEKKDELVLVLLKLRMGLRVEFLASLYNISSGTASQIFNTWIKFLAHELKPLIYWPDKEAILKNMPPSLKRKYSSLRCTLDCTEIFIGRPRNLEIQALTWSDYKKHNTVKFLVAIAPNGMISFLSKAWGGRASDVHITRESGFFNLIDPGDVVLADRGFTIKEDLLLKQAKLEIPPPSKGREQQTPSEVAKTKKIANARIHVERAIGRMKWFGILKETLPISMVPLVDDIIVVCAALVNLLPPLVSK